MKTTEAKQPRISEHAGYHVDERDLGILRDEAAQQGRGFSLKSIVEAAAPFDDGDRMLSLDELRRALPHIPVTNLPPQTGARVSPTTRLALLRAFRLAELDSHTIPELPSGLVRAIFDKRGVSSSTQYVSAYFPPGKRSDLVGLTRKNEVYFGIKQFGRPDRFFGPFHIDQRGVLLESAPPYNAADVARDGARFHGFQSCKEARRVITPLSLSRLDKLLGDDKDDQKYVQISQSVAARLTRAERTEVEQFWSYRGGESGALNPSLRNAKGRRLSPGLATSVELLDRVMTKAVLLPKGTWLYRGYASAQPLRVGAKVQDPAFLCTTLDPDIARMFSSKTSATLDRPETLMAIEITKPTHAVPTGNVGELELVLPRDLPMRVVSSTREDGMRLVHVRV